MSDDILDLVQRMEAAAEKATPGSWGIELAQEPGASIVTAKDDKGHTLVVCEIEVAKRHNATLTHIATADPPNVLRLCKAWRALASEMSGHISRRSFLLGRVKGLQDKLREAQEENEKLRQTLFDVVENGGMMRCVAEIEDDYVVVPHPETMKRVREALRSGGEEGGEGG